MTQRSIGLMGVHQLAHAESILHQPPFLTTMERSQYALEEDNARTLERRVALAALKYGTR